LETCIGAGECIRNCSKEALKLVDGRAVLVNSKLCADCKETACEFSCPTGAITIKYQAV
jgi:ferredoxin